MAGSHRAEKPRKPTHGLTPFAVGIAVVLALVPAAWFTAQRLTGDSPAPSDSSSPTRTPIPPISTPTTPASTPSPSPTKAASLARVAEDPPRRLVSGSVLDTGFDNAVEPSGGELTATSDDEVARWASRGSPGSPGSDTVVVVGRMSSGAPFEKLGELAKGSKVTIRTDEGELTYRVASTARTPVDGLLEDPLLTAKKPGRLVLVGNAYAPSGDRMTKDLVVVAELSGAKVS